MAVPFLCPWVQGAFLSAPRIRRGKVRSCEARIPFLLPRSKRGCTFPLGEKYQKPPGVAKLPCFIATPDPSPYHLCGAETGIRVAAS